MALSRRFLREILADREDASELIDEIIDAHSEDISPLKAELNSLMEENGGKTIDEIHAEVERIETEIRRVQAESVDENGVPYSEKIREIQEACKKLEGEQAYREKQKVYREILTSCGVPYKLRELILEADRTAIDGLDVSFGKVRNLEEIKSNIVRDYGEFIPKAIRSQYGSF